MIYFIHEFDRRLDVPDTKMVQIYKRMACGWEQAWPSNHMVGFYSRRYGLGADPQYMAVWELPNFAALDEWQRTWKKVKGFMEEIEADFHQAMMNERARVMEKLAPE